jgi:hypothetical protein
VAALALSIHPLPAHPTAGVILCHPAGGLPGALPGPHLLWRPDATLPVGARLAGGRPLEGALSPAELQALLGFALDRNDFFAFAPEQVAGRIAASQDTSTAAAEALAVPAGPPYLDAGTTAIAIEADGRRHEVRQQGLFAAAREHPQIAALAQLRAIEVRLLELAQAVAAAAGR